MGELNTIRKNLYLNGYIISPFGKKWIINADSTASGYLYKGVEEYMERNIKPFYANTHSNAITGKYMTECIEETKKIIRNEYNCKEDDMIIFTGNGCSGSIQHLIHALNIPKKCDKKNEPKRFVIFNSVLEHHSNYLQWKNLNVYLELIPINKSGLISQSILKEKLQYWFNNHKDVKIVVSFTGGSNVSGIIEDWSSISKLTHNYNGLMLWDMAACAPYVKINMHYNDDDMDYMDAIFVSPHKFLGGPGTPGLLIANKKLFCNSIPYCPAGGTVRFVCPNYDIYIPDIETKETGGTPNILGCIKLGKVFELKHQYQHYIDNKEKKLFDYIYPKISNITNLQLIVKPTIENYHIDNQQHIIPIFSFIIKNNEIYHYNLVVVLLNDLFGIQSRGGVSCCSVFAQYILQLNETEQKEIQNSISNGKGVPNNYGWCRVSFHYTMTKDMVDFILYAIEYIAKFIHIYKPLYEYDAGKNSWYYKGKWNDLKPSQKLLVEKPPSNYKLYFTELIKQLNE